MRLEMRWAAAALFLACVLPAPAAAQIRASERGQVRQTVDGTQIMIDYSRPVARGRSDLFGKVVKWGQVWTPGANDATVLELSRDVRIEGHRVPAGRWSVWFALSPDEPWEMVLDPRDSLFHTQEPRPTPDQVRFPLRREEGEHVEVLTWSFPAVTRTGTTIRMAWGNTHVFMDVAVDPSYTLEVPAEQAALYTGSWESGGRANRLEIRTDPDGQLSARSDSGEEYVLVPRDDGRFLMEFREFLSFGGDELIAFEVRDGVAVSISSQDEAGWTWASGHRVETAAADASPFAGVWEFVGSIRALEIRHRPDGALAAVTMHPSPDGLQEWEHLLIPVAEGIFIPGFLENGELSNVGDDIFWEFDFDQGRAVRFSARWEPRDRVFMTGTRR